MFRTVKDVLNITFPQIHDLKREDSKEQEKLKFILSLKFIHSNQSELGFHILSKITEFDTYRYIGSDFVEDLLTFRSTSFSFPQTLQILDFILRNASHTDSFAMAIHQHLIQYAQSATVETSNLSDVLAIISYMNKHLNTPEMTPELVQHLCSLLLKKISEVPVLRDRAGIQQQQIDSIVIYDFFRSLSERVELPNIVSFVLTAVYEIITRDQEISSLTSLGLAVIPDKLIAGAVSHIFEVNRRLNNQRKAIINAVKRLIEWQKTTNYNVPLHLWIVKVLMALREEKQNDILEEIISQNIAQCYLTLLMPLFQHRMIKVVQAMLECQRSEKIFEIIAPRIVKVLAHLETKNSEIFEPLMDVIADYIGFFPESNISCKEIIEFLEARNRSPMRNMNNYLRLPSAAMNNNVRVGLENLGNTCYMNSVLQALFMTKQFSRELLSLPRSDREIMAVQKIFALLFFSDRPELNLRFAMSAIRPSDFLPGIQHDSTEFMASLLDKLHEADKKFLKTTLESKEPKTDEEENQENAVKLEDVNMDDVKSENDTSDREEEDSFVERSDKVTDNTTELNQSTIVHKIFGGKMSTTCVCSSCKSKSIIIDSFRDIALSFPEKKNDDDWDTEIQYSVQELLNYYFSSEQLTLDMDNQYSCEKCKSLCDGIRLTELLQPPKNLILSLKHFRYDSRYHTRSKLLINKMFHDEEISVNVRSSHEANTVRPVNYRLYAAVVHSGVSLDSGHYYTFAREDNESWFKFNDGFVSTSTLRELHTLNSPNTPYILFYRRISTASSTASSSSACSDESLSLFDDAVPNFQELPQTLQSYIQEDNKAFQNESKRFSFQPNKSLSKSNRWNDDDPPSSCGSNFDVQHNRFIY